MHQTPWRIVTHHAEIGYCALCFREDQSAGLPFYWWLAWLDSASTMCVRHRWPLRYVRAASVNANRCNSLAGDGGKQYTAHTLCCRTFALCLRAEPLQRAVSGLLSSDTLTHHYALRDPATIRQVAGDLLDALLAANPLKRQHSTLSHCTVTMIGCRCSRSITTRRTSAYKGCNVSPPERLRYRLPMSCCITACPIAERLTIYSRASRRCEMNGSGC